MIDLNLEFDLPTVHVTNRAEAMTFLWTKLPDLCQQAKVKPDVADLYNYTQRQKPASEIQIPIY